MKWKSRLGAGLAVALAAASVRAQAPASLMKAQASVEPSRSAPGGSFVLHVKATLEPGWHVNSHTPSEDYLIPTEIRVAPPDGVSLAPARYPPGQSRKFSFSEEPLSVYEGSFEITAAGKISADASGSKILAGTLHYQPCNDKQCLAPASVAFRAEISVSPGTGGALVASPASPSGAVLPGAGNLAERGLLGTFALLFVGGLALNLTPCVYPIIPITIGFFGGQAGSRRTGKPVGLAALYVLGMAMTYSALGVFAALSGKLFGSALQSPWVLAGIAAVMILLSLSMFGLYDIQPPRFLMNRAQARTGWGGAFGMGLLVGVVAAPCLGPFVLGLLTYVAARHDAVLGFAMFFVLSLGLGLPYLVLASFSGAISRLPRAGEWMVEIKKIFGFVLLAMAAYFLRFILPEPVKSWLLPAVLAVGGLYVFLGVFQSRFPALARLVAFGGAAVLMGAAVHFVPESAPKTAPKFLPYDAATVRAAGRPAIVDFSADWCIPCHELDDITFADPRVRARLSAYALYRADMTRQDSPEAIRLSGEYGIQGMPTLVFLDASGQEIRSARLVGFEPPDAFLRRLDRIRAN
jgi:thiol:disulfide interchange protein DsbD